MRPLEYNSYHANDGSLLVGRITFYKNGTTNKENIYNGSGAVIANPIFTNQIGQTSQQVYLGDVDYLLYFEKYIGNGNMETDTDESHWLFQYSAVNQYDTLNIDISSDAIQIVDNVEALRKTNPIAVAAFGSNRLINLAGYNTPGDKPTVTYVWNPISIEADNGGSVIKVDDVATGRWEIINQFNDMLDVRHFGAFSAYDSEHTSVEQYLAIQAANVYATKIGAKLYFPASDKNQNAFYRVENVTLHNVIAAGNAVFVTDYGAVIELADGQTKVNTASDDNFVGVFTIRGKEISSLATKTNVIVEPSYKFIVESNVTANQALSFSNIVVDMRTDFVIISQGRPTVEFDDCKIEGAGKFDDPYTFVTLKNMIVSDSWFGPDFDWEHLDLENCVVDIDNFENVHYYIYCKNAMNDPDYGDLRGYTLTSEDTLLDNFYIKNTKGEINSTSIELNGKIENSNVEVKVQLGEADVVNSTVNMLRAIRNLTASRSTIDSGAYGGTDWNLTFCNILSTGTMYIRNLIASFCNFNTAVNCMADSELADCVIPGDLIFGYATTESNKCRVQRCNIGGNVHYGLYPNMEAIFTDNIIDGKIKWDLFDTRSYGNRTTVKNFVALRNKSNGSLIDWSGTKTWFTADDSKHNYIIDEELTNDFTIATASVQPSLYDYTSNKLLYMTTIKKDINSTSYENQATYTTDLSIMLNAPLLISVNAFGETNIKPKDVTIFWDESDIPGATCDALIHKDSKSTEGGWTFYRTSTCSNGRNPNFKHWITKPENRTVSYPVYDSTNNSTTVKDLTYYYEDTEGHKLFRFTPYIAEDNSRHIIPSSTVSYGVTIGGTSTSVVGNAPKTNVKMHAVCKSL